jgi:hypothetical protein
MFGYLRSKVHPPVHIYEGENDVASAGLTGMTNEVTAGGLAEATISQVSEGRASFHAIYKVCALTSGALLSEQFLHCRHNDSILPLTFSVKIPYLSATPSKFLTSPLHLLVKMFSHRAKSYSFM